MGTEMSTLAKQPCDAAGHHSRPDTFRLAVDMTHGIAHLPISRHGGLSRDGESIPDYTAPGEGLGFLGWGVLAVEVVLGRPVEALGRLGITHSLTHSHAQVRRARYRVSDSSRVTSGQYLAQLAERIDRDAFV